jgi:predicted enzyme related to lactoylglutathione lyase
MPETTPRACQVTINATDLPATVKFYQTAFGTVCRA